MRLLRDYALLGGRGGVQRVRGSDVHLKVFILQEPARVSRTRLVRMAAWCLLGSVWPLDALVLLEGWVPVSWDGGVAWAGCVATMMVTLAGLRLIDNQAIQIDRLRAANRAGSSYCAVLRRIFRAAAAGAIRIAVLRPVRSVRW